MNPRDFTNHLQKEGDCELQTVAQFSSTQDRRYADYTIQRSLPPPHNSRIHLMPDNEVDSQHRLLRPFSCSETLAHGTGCFGGYNSDCSQCQNYALSTDTARRGKVQESESQKADIFELSGGEQPSLPITPRVLPGAEYPTEDTIDLLGSIRNTIKAIKDAQDRLIEKRVSVELEKHNIDSLWEHILTLHFSQAKAETPHVSHEEFIQQLHNDGLTHIVPHAKRLDSTANYAVAPTLDPKKKRCRVGRPKGKILRADQGDNLARRLCCMHNDAEGFRLQVETYGKEPMVCYPTNQRDEME
ncbi:hypothetical protein P153DRAFT_64 [Dothidotthia symphoricarpi CBS 119687]|uniref:Uncharacterized protein n=1 Tax=Dothidotthia symphoricarpi CBS 119687 TaxID=1392245 RepID=A0A6A6AU40_9PLEO|nr:uncharacterized protein P153DRAFT_64 [Dothidotthia symphoricarpi CBS 119687]KAF2134357.1 hypothetical protein P153DRAFT_64 [Dothidotthia symphoricarpi CBS 119687]